MMSAVAIDLAVHFAITVGSRVWCRTRVFMRQDNLPFLFRAYEVESDDLIMALTDVSGAYGRAKRRLTG